MAWQRVHGRNDLPWQNTRDPYRVWLSEVMLQQTQVATVLGYFERFLSRFGDVHALAGAHVDEVMALWSGLGYYSRARNLHRCAMEVVQHHGGIFPDHAVELARLPGIGRSTAAAIAAVCFGERVAILDANVRRVLTRYLAFGSDLALPAAERQLWDEAQALLPRSRLMQTMPRYTQAVMDLGAMVCLPRQPLCGICPVHETCAARRQGTPADYPVRTRKSRRSVRSLWLLWAVTAAGDVWLQRRPPRGVWAALYCLPAYESRLALVQQVPERYRASLQDAAPIRHALTHLDLYLHPVCVRLPAAALQPPGQWFGPRQWPALGLPAPVRSLLQACGQPKDVDG